MFPHLRCNTFLGILALAALGVAPSGAVHAQSGSGCFSFWQALGGSHLDLDRVAALTGLRASGTEALYRAGEAVARECTVVSMPRSGSEDPALGPFHVAPLPAVAFVQLNTGYPRQRRDGLMWGGRGLAGGVTAGVHARWGPVSGALAPVLVSEENRAFAFRRVGVPGLSPYGSYFHPGVIDYPQRFGREGLTWVHPGQSYLRADLFGATAGLSTETLRWGPARRNPLLMSGAAPGFSHLFVGTSRPANVGIGRLEVEAIWGRLQESEFFDEDKSNDDRQLAGLLVAFSPGKDTGLTLGAARAYSRYIPAGGLPLLELVVGPYVNVRDNPTGAGADNQLLSVFFRWAFPEVGFEVYGEYARDDHWENFRDLLMEPDHSRAYTVGLQNVFTLREPGRRLRVAAEATNLNSSPTWQSGRGAVDFYTSAAVRQGHTHRGQLLGAPIGTGSDSQYLAADYIVPKWLLGLQLERVRYDNDVYYRYFRYPYTTGGHDAEWTVTLRGAAFASSVQVVGEIGYSTRHNRGFVHLPGGLNTTIENNLNLRLGLAWTPVVDRNDP